MPPLSHWKYDKTKASSHQVTILIHNCTPNLFSSVSLLPFHFQLLKIQSLVIFKNQSLTYQHLSFLQTGATSKWLVSMHGKREREHKAATFSFILTVICYSSSDILIHTGKIPMHIENKQRREIIQNDRVQIKSLGQGKPHEFCQNQISVQILCGWSANKGADFIMNGSSGIQENKTSLGNKTIYNCQKE